MTSTQKRLLLYGFCAVVLGWLGVAHLLMDRQRDQLDEAIDSRAAKPATATIELECNGLRCAIEVIIRPNPLDPITIGSVHWQLYDRDETLVEERRADTDIELVLDEPGTYTLQAWVNFTRPGSPHIGAIHDVTTFTVTGPVDL